MKAGHYYTSWRQKDHDCHGDSSCIKIKLPLALKYLSWHICDKCKGTVFSLRKVKWSRYTPWRRMGCLLILNLGNRWGWVVSITPRPRFIPGERTPCTHWTGGWVGPRAGLDAEATGKNLCPCRGMNPSCPVRSQTPYWLSYRGSFSLWKAKEKRVYLSQLLCQPNDDRGLLCELILMWKGQAPHSLIWHKWAE
jgi:hypothetical protein